MRHAPNHPRTIERRPATNVTQVETAPSGRSRVREAAARAISAIETLERRVLLDASADQPVTFSSTVSTTVPNLVAAPGELQSADFNADGKQDLAVGIDAGGTGAGAHPLTGTEVLLSNGDGSFTTVDGPAFPTPASGASATSTGAFAVLPLDGNARTDLLYASQSASGEGLLTLESNTGSGSSVSFSAGVSTTIPTPSAFNPQQVLAVNLHDITSDNGVDLAQLDLAVLGLNDTGGEDLVVLSGAGDGTFTEVDDFAIPGVLQGQIVAGTFLGSNGTELAVFDPSAGKLYTFENGIQTASSPNAANAISFSEGAAPIDLDTSGYAAGAVAATANAGQLLVAENPTGSGASVETSEVMLFNLTTGNPAGARAEFQPTAVAAPLGDSAGAIATGNFYGEGYPDVIDGYGINIDQDGSYVPAAALNASTGTAGYGAIVATDLNGDGKIDAAAADAVSNDILAAVNTSPANSSLYPTGINESVTSSPYPGGGQLVSGVLGSNYAGEVQFYSGSTLLDTTPVTGAQTYVDFRSPAGLSTAGVTARFLANDVYAASSSAPTATGTDILTPTLAGFKLPATIATNTKQGLTVPVTVTNMGSGASSGISTVAVSLSTTPDLIGATTLDFVKPKLRLRPHQRKRFNLKIANLNLSAFPLGSYYIVAQVSDSRGNYQIVASDTTFTLAAPLIDLSGSLRPVPARLKASKPVTVTLSVSNDGNIPAAGRLAVAFSARPAGTTGSADVPLATPAVKINLSPHATKALRYKFVLPTTLQAGTAYTLVALLDPANVFKDNNLANNTLVGTSSFTVE